MTTRRHPHSGPEQLSLLAMSDLPVQFRLDQRTRELGLARVQEIRRLLAARHADVDVARPRRQPDRQAQRAA